MQVDWPVVSAAALASFVEFVEALTIVLAVGAVRGWRSAFSGAAAAFAALALLVALVGPHLGGINVPLFKIIVGTLMMLFGLRWLRKAILRSAGVIALHDEAQSFARKSATLRTDALSSSDSRAGFDFGAAAAAFNGVLIEGIEVAFIVLTVGGSGHQNHVMQAAFGAAFAALAVVALGFIARHPLTRIPENALKLAVGVLVSAFGTFWAGEGMHLVWPGDDFALLLLSATYLALAGLAVLVLHLAFKPTRESNVPGARSG